MMETTVKFTQVDRIITRFLPNERAVDRFIATMFAIAFICLITCFSATLHLIKMEKKRTAEFIVLQAKYDECMSKSNQQKK